MKNFEITASKKVIATFVIDAELKNLKFPCTSKVIEFIKEKHPEYKNLPFDYEFRGDKVVISCFSVGDAVIQEL